MFEAAIVYSTLVLIVLLCAWGLIPEIARDRRHAKRMKALDRIHKRALARQQARFDALMLELRR